MMSDLPQVGGPALRWSHPTVIVFVLIALAPGAAFAQLLTHPRPQLDAVFPAGASRGTTVDVEFRGQDGITGGQSVVVDGPAGVTVANVEAAGNGHVKATLKIAADAPLGRRMLRVVSPRGGMSNFRYFFVGAIPEINEHEPNNMTDAAELVAHPVVVNGRISPTLDIDSFRFEARAGQKLVASILAFGMDSLTDATRRGYVDTGLELRDASGKVLAADEDSLGLDPLLAVQIPEDGTYTLTVKSLQYQGSEASVYRLTIGDVPVATALFPAGGRRGETVPIEADGANLVVGGQHSVSVTRDGSLLPQYVALDGLPTMAFDLPFIRGEHSELLESEPNNERSQANEVTLPMTANGRFSTSADEDWYRISLKNGEGIRLETLSQRFLGMPVDSQIEIYDATGKKVSENDDGAAFGGYVQCAHDFVSNDSWLAYRATADGEYFVRVRDLNGSSGPRFVYRLTIEPLQPDFLMYQWPDAVPIWGPGTTASLIVEVLKWGGTKEPIAVRIEGLPAGWTGSVTNWPTSWYGTWDGNGAVKLLLTITAPSDAPVGTVAPFRVIGRLEQDGRVVEREAQYMTLYGNSHNDRMHVRCSPLARAVVAEPLDTTIETAVTEISVVEGQTAYIPVKIQRREKTPASVQIGVVVNGPTPSAGCGWRAPISLAADQTEITVPLEIRSDWKAGDYGITLARSWSSDIRGGRPGPCTPLIRLRILPPNAAK